MTPLHNVFGRYTTAKISEIARQAGTSLAYLQQCKYGHRRMSADLALKLEHASGGLLAAYELRPDLPWPHAPRPDPVPESGGASPVAPSHRQAAGAFSRAEPQRDPELTPS